MKDDSEIEIEEYADAIKNPIFPPMDINYYLFHRILRVAKSIDAHKEQEHYFCSFNENYKEKIDKLLEAIQNKDKNLAEWIQKFITCYIALCELNEISDKDAINNVLIKLCDELNKSIDNVSEDRLRDIKWDIEWRNSIRQYTKNRNTDLLSEFDKLISPVVP